MNQVRARILIEGKLHGMNFRLKTQQQAARLGLAGFVRSLSDGRVEIEAQGDEEMVESLLNWCQQEPHGSSIKSILFRYDEPNKNYADFMLR